MAIRRVGSARLPDNPSNVWAKAPNRIHPGDIMADAPDFGGQSMREAQAPIITEDHMAFHEVSDTPETHRKHTDDAPKKPSKPKVRAVLPPEAKRFVVLRSPAADPKTPINLRMPSDLLEKYKSGGPGYQTRMIAVLELFLAEGGQFIEI